jgi:Ca2+-binding EF-hand superfamily protein
MAAVGNWPARQIGVLGLALMLAVPVGTGWAVDAQEEERRFKVFDSNNDGKISQEEFSNNKVQGFLQRPGRQEDRAVQISASESHLTPQSFQMLDINADGILTGGEIISAQVLQFSALDTNGDGSIDRAEFHAIVVKMMK